MAKLKIVINPLSIIALFLFIYFGWIGEVLFYVIALVIHEYAHYYVAKRLGYNLNYITFSPFGASLSGSKNFFKLRDEIKIALAGPLVNLFLAIVFVALWWIFPATYTLSYSFVLSNASLFIFNMLPLFPLDAGRIVLALIHSRRNFAKIYKLYRVNSIVVGIIFLGLFVWSAFGKINLSTLFVGILLIMSSFDLDKSLYYKYAYIEKLENNTPTILPAKEYVVPINTTIPQLLKLIDKNTFSVFNFVDNSGRIIKTINEKQLLDLVQETNNIQI